MTRRHKQLAAAGAALIGIGLLVAGVSWSTLLLIGAIAAMAFMHLGGHGGHGGHGAGGGSEPSGHQHAGGTEDRAHSHNDTTGR